MIILDTNVIYESMRPAPNQKVSKWLDAQIAETLFTTSVTLAEILTGVSLLPDGKRKNTLRESIQGMIEHLFQDRITAFTSVDAEHHATIVVMTKSFGYNISFADAQIATIARNRGMKVATRDTAPFEAAGIETINPWND